VAIVQAHDDGMIARRALVQDRVRDDMRGQNLYRLWCTCLLVDEVTQRLTLGWLVEHPERADELGLDERYFDGRCRTGFAILMRHITTCCTELDCPRLFKTLSRDRVIALIYDCQAEWDEAPASIEQLRTRLCTQWLRRRLNVVGELLIESARDPRADHDRLVEAIRIVIAELHGLEGAA
jgi:hypothetical protein